MDWNCNKLKKPIDVFSTLFNFFNFVVFVGLASFDCFQIRTEC